MVWGLGFRVEGFPRQYQGFREEAKQNAGQGAARSPMLLNTCSFLVVSWGNEVPSRMPSLQGFIWLPPPLPPFRV